MKLTGLKQCEGQEDIQSVEANSKRGEEAKVAKCRKSQRQVARIRLNETAEKDRSGTTAHKINAPTFELYRSRRHSISGAAKQRPKSRSHIGKAGIEAAGHWKSWN
jgi:hypothetical protein